MKILSIETSCDETAISIVDTDGKEFKVLGNSLLSQINLHKEYGGVFPTLAKREHSRNLIPVLKQVLEKAGFENFKLQTINDKIKEILNREPELLEQFLKFIPTIQTPDIDAIAVTQGPGLEPALWVGINFAKALSVAWKKPIIPVNHMEGHIFSALLKEDGKDSKFYIQNLKFPILALLISGGHTQLVLSKKFLEYEIIGETLDDAVGEAFDKTARMLGLPYPGGPEISKLAEKVGHVTSDFKFPRPMLRSNTCDFSFSGLKTSVLYTLKKIPKLTNEIKQKVAKEFEDAVIEVLIEKTKKALIENDVKTLVIGGGVAANKKIRETFEEVLKNEFEDKKLYIPTRELSTDNAIMIAVVGYFRSAHKQKVEIRADGNLSL
ncbi:MAG: tRNA (adenosine(37)-N6)-threonylcarbamoyltransferase complex transferase subunit TsaD [Candidatus Pacebacteria bacterium]|jgi:N6-L-threonylcarbamoyladenine synthase|nr:tRNA (adenosine(37)-N6)-threonylcarbamoyltransferase complex transferase subunit TsaD [Candidatus Paceibacterota bacterium]|tara:strand:- start:7709 stop:8848 length:1140 start_codon:yes stop_codon:yes gene_type:complete